VKAGQSLAARSAERGILSFRTGISCGSTAIRASSIPAAGRIWSWSGRRRGRRTSIFRLL